MSVNITKYILDIPQIKQLIIAIMLIFFAFSAGYGVNEASTTENTYDIFSNKAETEVNPMMNHAVKYPTEGNLRNANNVLAVIEWSWINQNEGENKELFSEYVDACQLVIDEMQAGNEPDTSEMNRLYTSLTD